MKGSGSSLANPRKEDLLNLILWRDVGVGDDQRVAVLQELGANGVRSFIIIFLKNIKNNINIRCDDKGPDPCLVGYAAMCFTMMCAVEGHSDENCFVLRTANGVSFRSARTKPSDSKNLSADVVSKKSLLTPLAKA